MNITVLELCSLKDYDLMPQEHRWNIQELFNRVSRLRAYAKMPFVMRTKEHPNRGYRSWDAHCKVYEDLMHKMNTKIKIPTKSQHLIGAAVDISDPKRELQRWIMRNLEIVEKLDLYFEHFDASPTWTHVCLFPPESGLRFFMP